MNLEAYRRGRIEEALAAAEQVAAEADAASRRRLDDAARTAEAMLAAARADATAQADRDTAAAMARERRRARTIVLGARRAVYEDLMSRVHVAAVALRTEPAYDRLLEALEGVARRQLGDGAIVVRDPTPSGGIVAEADGRRVDYTLLVLAEFYRASG